ncbi:MAG: hypothetical protein AAF447_13000 [Myxococcota bacterium]
MTEPADLGARLRGDEGLRRQGVALLVDVLLARPVGDLIEPIGLVEVIVEALSEANLDRVVEAHAHPAWDRHRSRSAATRELVGNMIDEPSRERLRAWLEQPRAARADWLRGAVDLGLLRQLLAPVLGDTLVAFAKRLPGVELGTQLGSGLGGIAGAFRGAFREGLRKGASEEEVAESAPKKEESGAGAKVQALARDFATGALGTARQQLEARFRSDEGRELLGQLRAQIFAALLAAPVAEVMDDLDAIGRQDLVGAFPGLLSHNAGRRFVAEALREEVEACVAVEGTRSLRDALEGAGVLPGVRAYLRLQGERLFDAALADDAFAAYLQGLTG